MDMILTHTLHDAIEVSYQNQMLFKYVYASKCPAVESPRPYFHPVKTLNGNEVSLFRPYDHLWHVGITMSIANLSGENFWGGPTYTREVGWYSQLDNNGYIQHTGWGEMQCDDELRCIEYLKWITHPGIEWLNEERQIVIKEIDPVAGCWVLDLSFHLVNISGQLLDIGSPTTEGRPNAGYGGLFWRGPRSFLYGNILGADGLEGPDMMGKRSPWLAFIGNHDGDQSQSTILFIDQPDNPRYPNKWFVRNDPYACVSCSFMFDECYTLQPDDKLALAYRIAFCNGEWSRSQIEEYIAAHQRSPGYSQH
jgi:Methane oxygenase PmoA